MVERLPVVSSDIGTWGGILNGFLLVAHNADGTALSPHFVDFVAEYGVDNTGGGEAGNNAAHANLITDLTDKTTRAGIRDIIMFRPGDLIDFNTTWAWPDLPGVRLWFLSSNSMNETVEAGSVLGFYRWTGAANTYAWQIRSEGVGTRGMRMMGCLNMVTANDLQGWAIHVDNEDNYAIEALAFGCEYGGGKRWQRGITLSCTLDNAHAYIGALYSNNVQEGAVVCEGGGLTVMAGSITLDHNQIGAYTNGYARKSPTDGATTNASPTVTSATAAFTNFDLGRPILGTGIPLGAYIRTINSPTSVAISANATATGSGLTLTIGSLVPGSELKFCPAVKIDGGGTEGGAIGVLNYGGNTKVLGVNFEGFNSDERTVTDMVTNATTTITSATAAFTAGDAPSGLRPGREVSGTNIPVGSRIASVTNATTAVITIAATGSGSGGTLTITNRAIGVDTRRVDNNGYSARGLNVSDCTFTGHDTTMLPMRFSYAPGGPGAVGNAYGSNVRGNVFQNCVDLTGGATDQNFFPGYAVTDFCDTWHSYHLLQRGTLTVVS